MIIIPLNPPSLIKVLEPTPSTLILPNPFIFFRKIDNSFKFFGLNTTFAGPPKLNHEYFERFSSNIILPETLFFITTTLNKLSLKKIRNNIIVKTLPSRV